MKVKKRIILIVLVLMAGFVLADYVGLFPSICKDMGLDLVYNFEIIDSVNGTPVEGVVINATYKDSDAVIKSIDAGGGIYYIRAYGGRFGYTQTIFFKKPSPRQTIKEIKNKEIDFTFQHPLYKTFKKTYQQGKPREIYTVELVPAEDK